MLQPTPLSLKTLHVIIRNRERVLLESDAKSFTSSNVRGIFDVLPGHANFISIIKDFIRVVKADGTKQEMKIEGGVAQVMLNNINVFLGIVPTTKQTTNSKK